MKYTPSYPLDLFTEVRRLQQALAALETEIVRYEPLRGAPPRPELGGVAYADGVAWAPAGGAGLQLYNGTSWERLLTTPIGEHQEAIMTAEVQLLVAGTWYDAVSLTLAAGTWLLLGRAEIRRTVNTAVQCAARIYDGTTTVASGGGACNQNNSRHISLQCMVIPTASTTYKLQASSSVGAADIRIADQSFYNPTTDTATILTAVRLR